MNLEVDSKGEVYAHLNERSLILSEDTVCGRERVTTDEERVLRWGSTEIRLWR